MDRLPALECRDAFQRPARDQLRGCSVYAGEQRLAVAERQIDGEARDQPLRDVKRRQAAFGPEIVVILKTRRTPVSFQSTGSGIRAGSDQLGVGVSQQKAGAMRK